MTKNVRIQKSGVNQDFEDVKTITTAVQGGLNATWMPEDEAIIGEITITENGEFTPSEYDIYGFYSVTVMVPGGTGAEIIPHEGTDPSYVTPLPATGLGASVIGIDPLDDAVYRIEIQDVDGTSTLVKTKVADSKAEYKPASIKILIEPDKLSYKNGEKIKYTGLVVGLIDSTNYIFVDEIFPQGTISWSPIKNTLHPEYDLITPTETALYDSASAISEIPVKWKSPYDNQIYEDTFEIEVSNA